MHRYGTLQFRFEFDVVLLRQRDANLLTVLIPAHTKQVYSMTTNKSNNASSKASRSMHMWSSQALD